MVRKKNAENVWQQPPCGAAMLIHDRKKGFDSCTGTWYPRDTFKCLCTWDSYRTAASCVQNRPVCWVSCTAPWSVGVGEVWLPLPSLKLWISLLGQKRAMRITAASSQQRKSTFQVDPRDRKIHLSGSSGFSHGGKHSKWFLLLIWRF